MATRRLVVEVIGDDKSFKRAVQNTAASTDKLEKKFSNLDSTVGDFNRSMTAAGNVVKLVKFPALIAGAGMAAQAVGALGAGVIGLGSALAPLAGLGAAGAAGLTAFGQAAGVAGLALAGVGGALKEQLGLHNKAGAAAAKAGSSQVSSARAVRDAEEGVRTARLGVGEATRSLTDALRGQTKATKDVAVAENEARRNLADMRSGAVDAILGVRQATLSLTDARRTLTSLLSGPDIRAVADAHEAVADSVRDEQHAVLALTDARDALDKLLRGASVLDLADAHDAVADAARDETRANLALADAKKAADAVIAAPASTEEAKAKARLSVADAENAVEDAKRASERAAEKLKELETPASQQEVAKARLAVADAENAVGDAKNGSKDAQDALTKAEAGPGAEDIAKARLAVAEAEQTLTVARRDNRRQQADLAKAESAGVQGAPGVVSAREAVAQAERDVADARRGVSEASRGVAQALQRVRDAQQDATASATKAVPATADLSAQFHALPAAAQQFVRELIAMKPKLDALREVAAAGLFPGVIAGLHSAVKNFGPVKSVVGETARALGDLARSAGALVGSKGFGRDLETVGHRNVGIIRNVGTAALISADGLRHLIVAAGPLTTWLSKLTVQGADWVRGQIVAGRESGKLAGFFEQTRQVATTLGHIFVNLAAGLFNIGKAAAPLGRDLLHQFEQLTEKFRAWTNSVAGRNTLRQYFADAKAPLMQVFGLVGDIGGAFLRLSQGKGATPLLQQLRSLVPVIESVVASTTAAFGPALISTLGDLVRLFGHLAGSSGPLVHLVQLIGLIAQGFSALLDTVPGLNSLAVSAFGLYGTMKALSIVFGPLAAGATALEGALIGQAAAANLAAGATLRERAAMIATAIAMYATRAATIAMTVATTALDVALVVLTSPITLVIAGLALLAAGVIYAYKHSDTFRKIVNGMWAVLKVVAQWMVTFGAAAFTAVGNAAKVAWTTVDTVTRTVWGGLKSFLGGIWTGLQTTATTVWDAIKTAILTPIRAVRDALSGKGGIWATIHKDATAAWDRIKAGVGDFATGVKDAVVSAFEGAANKVIDFVNEIIKVINLIPGVPNIKKIGHIGGSGGGKSSGGGGGPHGTGKLAKGGMVPGSGYGDKVPLHIAGKLAAMVEPGEMVSVANRNATAALMGVNSAIPRFADGGVLSGFRKAIGEVKPPPKANLALWEAGIVESALRNLTGGDRDSRGALQIRDSTARGMGINNMDPYASAVAFLTRGFWGKGGADILAIQNPKQSAGWVAQNTQGSAYPGRYDQVMSQALNYVKGYKGPVGGGSGVLGDIVSALNPLDFIKKLPGIGDLPDWMKGTGKYVLDKVGDWIKHTVASIIPGGGETSTKGLVPQVKRALAFARGHGWHGQVNSGFRTFAEQQVLYNRYLAGGNIAAKPGTSSHEKGQAVDVSDIPAFARAMAMAPANSRLLSLVPGDPVHFSVTGHARGGIVAPPALPYVGKFHQGGYAPAEGYAHVAKNERIGGPAVHIENVIVDSKVGVNSLAERIAFRVATA